MSSARPADDPMYTDPLSMDPFAALEGRVLMGSEGGPSAMDALEQAEKAAAAGGALATPDRVRTTRCIIHLGPEWGALATQQSIPASSSSPPALDEPPIIPPAPSNRPSPPPPSPKLAALDLTLLDDGDDDEDEWLSYTKKRARSPSQLEPTSLAARPKSRTRSPSPRRQRPNPSPTPFPAALVSAQPAPSLPANSIPRQDMWRRRRSLSAQPSAHSPPTRVPLPARPLNSSTAVALPAAVPSSTALPIQVNPARPSEASSVRSAGGSSHLLVPVDPEWNWRLLKAEVDFLRHAITLFGERLNMTTVCPKLPSDPKLLFLPNSIPNLERIPSGASSPRTKHKNDVKGPRRRVCMQKHRLDALQYLVDSVPSSSSSSPVQPTLKHVEALSRLPSATSTAYAELWKRVDGLGAVRRCSARMRDGNDGFLHTMSPAWNLVHGILRKHHDEAQWPPGSVWERRRMRAILEEGLASPNKRDTLVSQWVAGQVGKV